MQILKFLFQSVIVCVCFSNAISAHALEVAIRAPLGYIDISLAEAKEIASGESKSKKNCENRNYRLNECRIYPYFVNDCPIKLDYWAKIEDVYDGITALRRLAEHASDGNYFDNAEGSAKIVIETTDSNFSAQHLALCNVRVIDGKAGPPQNCFKFAILTPDLTLIRASRRYNDDGKIYVNCGTTTQLNIRLAGTMDITFAIVTKFWIEVFAEQIGYLIQNELGFAMERKEYKNNGTLTSIHFIATAPLRESRILSPEWREAVDLDLTMNLSSDELITVFADARPLVSNLASGNLIEYRPLSDAQRALYGLKLNERINRALLRACPHPTQGDDKTITCD